MSEISKKQTRGVDIIMSKKTIRKADLGLTPTETKGNLTPMELRELKKATEMAKPVDILLESLYEQYKEKQTEAQEIKEKIMYFAPLHLKEGYRFESFIYVKESEIPDQEAIARFFQERENIELPMRLTTDWRKARDIIEEQYGSCPMKTKSAYLREVTR